MDQTLKNQAIILALKEDSEQGDHTSLACIPGNAINKAILKVKENGIISGINVAKKVISLIDPSVAFHKHLSDGDRISYGDTAFSIEGNTQAILKAERILLNLMQRMSGIATMTSKYVEQINTSAQNMHKQLINLLHWARMQTGNIKVNIGKTNLATLVDEIFAVLLPQSQLKEIDLKNNINFDVRILADSSMLSTVIQNLTSNAIKFTHKKGFIVISAITISQQTTISITDNGIGMNKEQIDDLFNIAKTPRRRGTSNEIGTGLGIIICKEFVEKMGGEIWVESSENTGTTMHIKLPTAQ